MSDVSDDLPPCDCGSVRLSADRRGIDQHEPGCSRRTARVARRGAFERDRAERERRTELLDRFGNDDDS